MGVYIATSHVEDFPGIGLQTSSIADSIILADATSAAFTVTLPAPSGISGRQYTIEKIASTSGNIDGAATKALSAQWQTARVVSDGANW